VDCTLLLLIAAVALYWLLAMFDAARGRLGQYVWCSCSIRLLVAGEIRGGRTMFF
jgi:hypothetical protein